MSALLSVTKHETDKMALYVNDTRNMGVEVLPPDVNASSWDFTIEDRQGQKPAIRFGLGAIKNVGQGPVELISQARAKDGAFRDLNDFAAHVDLRAAGKRALESLIKVGAMDCFGSRTAMLEALDRVVAVSSSHFRAAESGQLSLFGAHTGVTESVTLPLVPDADRRETLTWERELIGMYMGEHPLTPYMNEIRRVVSHFSSNLSEADHEEKVRVAGMVTGIRPHQTKTGRMMAWVTLEDLTGTIELVVFPRTWEKFQFALEVGGVILAEGKVDAQSTPSKVLVDNIRTEIKLTEPAQLAPGPQAQVNGVEVPRPGPDGTGQAPTQMVLQPQRSAPGRSPKHVADRPAASHPKSSTSPPVSRPDAGPPPPEDPPDWENYQPADAAFTVPDLVVHVPDLPEEEPVLPAQVESLSPGQATVRQAPINPPPAVLTPKLPAAAFPARLDEDHPPQILTVILHPTGDSQRDIRRISRLHGTFISYPGKDRFAFQIFEEGRAHLIEFPNDTTHLCADLMTRIKDAVGEENLRLEPILYL